MLFVSFVSGEFYGTKNALNKLSVGTKYIDENIRFLLGYNPEYFQAWFRRYAVLRKACFLPLVYTRNSIAFARTEKTNK